MLAISVDIETDGPIPGDYSMISLGAVVIEESLNRKYYSTLSPISDDYVESALAISDFSREETLTFLDPYDVMNEFSSWLELLVLDSSEDSLPIFVGDNNGFDFMFVSWYFWHFLGRNPFGHSSQNINSWYRGLTKTTSGSGFKKFRKTKHTHNALDDAISNATAVLAIQQIYDCKLV